MGNGFDDNRRRGGRPVGSELTSYSPSNDISGTQTQPEIIKAVALHYSTSAYAPHGLFLLHFASASNRKSALQMPLFAANVVNNVCIHSVLRAKAAQITAAAELNAIIVAGKRTMLQSMPH